jgi:enediyne biosynthesis protein E5
MSSKWPDLLRGDPRLYQIGALALLLLYGLLQLKLEIGIAPAGTVLATTLLAQFAAARLWKLPAFDPRSALISGLSLCLLLRTNSVFLAGLAGLVAIAGKFLVRWQGKHLFNPTNFSLVVMLLLSRGAVWVSPGQWGDFAFFGFLVVCVGGLVVNRASRVDVTIAFLICFLALVFGRSAWLNEPLAIPFHRLRNGALLVFAFFMISDPRTTPDSRAGRILFAALVAAGAGFVQFKLFRTNGMLWSLATCSLFVPLIDWLLPGQRYAWTKPATVTRAPEKVRSIKGKIYEPIPI